MLRRNRLCHERWRTVWWKYTTNILVQSLQFFLYLLQRSGSYDQLTGQILIKLNWDIRVYLCTNIICVWRSILISTSSYKTKRFISESLIHLTFSRTIIWNNSKSSCFSFMTYLNFHALIRPCAHFAEHLHKVGDKKGFML